LSYSFDAALASVRRHRVGGTVSGVTVAGGFMHLSPATPSVTVPGTLQTPVPLAWDGLETGRFTLTMPVDAASFMHYALSAGAVLLKAHAEIEIVGVAPRLPLQVLFDPKALLGAIESAVAREKRFTRAELEAFFESSSNLPVQFMGDLNSVDRKALAV